jgi:hypothetical protein
VGLLYSGHGTLQTDQLSLSLLPEWHDHEQSPRLVRYLNDIPVLLCGSQFIPIWNDCHEHICHPTGNTLRSINIGKVQALRIPNPFALVIEEETETRHGGRNISHDCRISNLLIGVISDQTQKSQYETACITYGAMFA